MSDSTINWCDDAFAKLVLAGRADHELNYFEKQRAMELLARQQRDEHGPGVRRLLDPLLDIISRLRREAPTQRQIEFVSMLLCMKCGGFSETKEECDACEGKAPKSYNTLDFMQQAVGKWMIKCFGETIPRDRLERADRACEESLELLQSLGFPKERALALVDWVYDRPPGQPEQEVGGVMVTLLALCWAYGVSCESAAATELARIMKPDVMERIREKQAAKPTGSALPMGDGNG